MFLIVRCINLFIVDQPFTGITVGFYLSVKFFKAGDFTHNIL